MLTYYRNLVVLAGIGPLLMLSWDAWQGQLGANSVNIALHITGLLSLVFLFLSLLVTPLKVMTGWNSLIAIRRALGLYGFAYAALHFGIYVLFDRMGSFRSTVDEILTRRYLLVGFIGFTLMIPLAVTSTNAMIRRLGSARWKLLHRLAYLSTILGVVHYFMLVKSDLRQPVAFAAVLAPILGFRGVKHYLDLRRAATKLGTSNIATPNSPRPFWSGDLMVANIIRETHDVKTFRFVMPGGRPIPFSRRPGQYMNLSLNVDGRQVKRSYTIASSSLQQGYVELTIRRNPHGVASQFLHDSINVGDMIRISAPAGKFYFDDLNAEGIVLIAGGVGITPLMSILRSLTDQVWKGRIYFINAVRTSDDRIYAAELNSLAHRFENVSVRNYFSRSSPTERCELPPTRWQDKVGYINAAEVNAFVPELETLPIFLCGPEAMMQSVRMDLVANGIPSDHISTEEFVSPKAAASEATGELKLEAMQSSLRDGELSTITFSASSQNVEIDVSTTILEAAERAGVALPWECRSGICGQCKVRCTEGRVRMDSQDAITSAEITQGYILACQAHPLDATLTIES